HAGMRLAGRDEPLCDAPLLEDLEGPSVEPTGALPVHVLVGAALDHHRVDAGQGQLARQHQPGWTPTGDGYLVLGHALSPGVIDGRQTSIHTTAQSLAARPPVGATMGVREGAGEPGSERGSRLLPCPQRATR